MSGATVPEATVYEYGDLSAGERDIDATAPIARHRPVDPVPHAGCVEEMSQLQLRACIATTVGLHVPAHRG